MENNLYAKLIVLDTGPLITLSAADSLDYLLYPNIPVYLPDAVLFEATRDSATLGAAEILEWVQKNSERVKTLSTQVFFNYIESISTNPARREKDLGERAAIEAIHDSVHLEPQERAILVTEDDRALRRVLVIEAELNNRMIPITTRDFLEGMENAGRINSVDDVYARAQNAGRLASQRSILKFQNEQAMKAVERVLKRPIE